MFHMSLTTIAAFLHCTRACSLIAVTPRLALLMILLDSLMRTRYVQFGKQMIRAALAKHGPVETDAEVPAEARRIDLWFMPDSTREPVPDHIGLLGRLTAGPSTLELCHNTPGGDELAAYLIKHGQFRH